MKIMDLFRLLSLETLHRRVEIEKLDCRKESSEKGMSITPTNIRIIRNEKGNDFQLKSATQEKTENQSGKDSPD